MAVYSHSKLSSFEQCPYQYKLKYIDKVKVDIPTTIEAFMGDMVHRTLEKLYKYLGFEKILTKPELLDFYNLEWNKEYSDDILIVKENQGLTAENYRIMGVKYLSNYYDKNYPFDQFQILGLETQDKMILPNGDYWHVRIDKLACDNEGNYYVMDYKTNSRMKTQEEADSDRQLALYSVWVKDKFRDVKSVKLVWHMLAFNKDAISERSEEQLIKLQEEVIEKIREIENATEFPTRVGFLCSYCVYKEICPSFGHKIRTEQLTLEKFKEDEGVKLVDEYSKIKTEISELKKEEDDVKNKLIGYSKQFSVDYVYGSNHIAKIKEFDKVVLPEDKARLIEILKEKNLYDKYSMVCSARLNSHIQSGEITDKDILDLAERVKDFRLSLVTRKDVEE